MNDRLKIFGYIEDVLQRNEKQKGHSKEDKEEKLNSLLKDLDDDDFSEFLKQLSSQFVGTKDEVKFELCEMITYSLALNPKYFLSGETEDKKLVLRDLAQGTFDIVTSRLSKDLRLPVIHLLSVLLRLNDGYHWLTCLDEDEKYVKLFELVTRLSCIEITLGVDSSPVDTASMCSCFTILEYSILTLIGEDCEDFVSKLPPENIYNLIKAIRETMSVLLDYLNNLQARENLEDEKEFMLAMLRLICVWLSEDTDVLLEEVRSVLPLMMKVYISESGDATSDFPHIIITAFHSLTEDVDSLNCIQVSEMLEDFENRLRECKECTTQRDLCKSFLTVLESM
ncbi:Neurochondrin [Halotydeus destructor]|nr:Neurochondrin [Halotydeus destructor]